MNRKTQPVSEGFDFVRWLRFTSIAYILGVGFAASLPVLVYFETGLPQDFRKTLLFFGLFAVGGLFKGILVGYFQWLVLQRVFRRLNFVHWLRATCGAATIGWMIVFLPLAAVLNPMPNEAFPNAVSKISVDYFLLRAAFAGAIYGAIFGGCQWFVLRKLVKKNAWLWILANIIGWAVGFGMIYMTATFPDKYTPKVIVCILCSFGGELAGAFVNLATGFSIERMEPLAETDFKLK